MELSVRDGIPAISIIAITIIINIIITSYKLFIVAKIRLNNKIKEVCKYAQGSTNNRIM